MKKTFLALVAGLAMLMLPVPGSAAFRGGFRGGVFVGGPGYWGGWGPGYYSGPGYYPYGYGYYAPNSGEVKIDTPVKTAEVWINGSYAGTVKEAHTLHLRPGNYDVQIREGGRTLFTQNVFVAPGKTMHLKPVL
jgi:hypothetical protein